MSPPPRNLYRHGFFRAALATPVVHPAEPMANLEETQRLASEAAAGGARLAVFPELGLSGYAIDDLLLQDALLDAVERALSGLIAASAKIDAVIVVGGPARAQGALYNCAFVIGGGSLLGVVPKQYLPNYREFYEKRWFASGLGVTGAEIAIAGTRAPFGVDLIFDTGKGPTFGVEICEDLWAPIPPSSHLAQAGAEAIVNLSASNVTIAKADEREMLARAQAARCACAYLYCAAGPGESTTDLAWDGHVFAYELSERIAAAERFPLAGRVVFADLDVDRIRQERLRSPTFRDGRGSTQAMRVIAAPIAPPQGACALVREIPRFPFVPADPARLDQDCFEAYEIQVSGLQKRLSATGVASAIIGVSGGLDSTHALLVTAQAFDRLKRPRAQIRAYTLPGFATSSATKANAWALMKALGVHAEELDIRPAAKRMLKDLGHPAGAGEAVYDVTFENVQAGLRTDFLFRLANQHQGLVIGTGDLSELALGWCTYGVGDHMSHYGVNAGAAKTLISHLIRWCANSGRYDAATAEVLRKILSTEISPELVPAGADGKIQSTQDTIGPYALHDFFLHYLTRHGFRPSKIAFLAEAAWGDPTRGAWPPNLPEAERRGYDRAEIRRWLKLFLTRFFANQFKRSAIPNGPKLTSAGALSPRGDWRAPSDAAARAWLQELEESAD